jgi:hypothetical protein
MLRGIRRTIAAVAVAALAFSGLVLCPCEATAAESDHGCCSPVAAWQAAGDCCGVTTATPPAAIAPAGDTPALGVSSVTTPVSSARGIVPFADVAAVVSLLRPPRTILRI